MSTMQQTLANQENAQSSTGPRTEEGKKIVALNALRHGLTSQLVILPNESKERYETFKTALLRDLKAEGAVELMLAETICDTYWRLERGRAAEDNVLARGHLEPQPDYVVNLEMPDVQTALIEAGAWERHERVLHNIHLQEARLHRILSKTLAELRDEQARRNKLAQQQLEDTVAAFNHHKQNHLPFEPSEFGFVSTIGEIERAALREQWRKRIR